jgi:imidazolonepropionase-like amidohydrolase
MVILVGAVAQRLGRPDRASAAEPGFALVGATVLSAPNAAPIVNATVLVEHGKIAAVGPRRDVPVPDGVRIIDCADRFITAGFWNSHIHFIESKWQGPASQPAAQLEQQLRAMLGSHGFVAVVDTGSNLEDTVALRRRIEKGEVAGPAIRTAGWPLFPKNGVPFYLRDALPVMVRMAPQPKTAQEAANVVARSLDAGADIVKLFTGSWVKPNQVMPMPIPVASGAVDEAHRRGRLVWTHASNLEGLEVALAAHVDVLAHAIEDTRGLTAAHLDQMKRQRMAMIPTLKLFDSAEVVAILKEVSDFARAGGEILFGTDVGYLSDYDPTEEYARLGRAGLGWREILAALTINPAARFGATGHTGRIAVGMDADLVVLAADPTRDVRAFANARYTVRSGHIIHDSVATATNR